MYIENFFSVRNLTLIVSLAFAVLYAINPNWIYSPIGDVDSWAYVGHALNPVGLRQGLPSHPSGDLLPLIWPSAVFYALFPPLAANFLLKWLFFTLTGVAFSRLVFLEFGARTAALMLAYLLSFKYFLVNAGSDYPAARVIFYLTMAFVFAAEAAHSSGRRSLYLILSGAFFAGSAATAFLSLIFGLPLALFILGRSWVEGRLPKVSDAVVPLSGFFATLGIMSILHWSYTGDFFFFRNTIAKTQKFLDLQFEHLARGVHNVSLFETEWLQLPMLGILAPLVAILLHRQNVFQLFMNPMEIVRRHRQALLIWLMNFSFFATLVYLQWAKGQETIAQYLYFTQCVTLNLFCLAGIILKPALDSLEERVYRPLLAFTAVSGMVALILHVRGIQVPDHIPGGIFYLLLLLSISLFAGTRRSVAGLSLFFAVALPVNLYTKSLEQVRQDPKMNSYAPSRADLLESAVRWTSLMNTLDPERRGHLWYNSEGERAYLRTFSAVSHLWVGRILNESLPALNVKISEKGIVNPNSLSSIVLVTESEEEFNSAIENLRSNGTNTLCKGPHLFSVSAEKSIRVEACDVQTKMEI